MRLSFICTNLLRPLTQVGSTSRYSPSVAPVRVDPKQVREFEDEGAFHAWLAKHAARENEVWIKIHKVRSGKRSITPTEAIDVVLCWGWIDGIRKGFDEHSFLQRYTPRRKKSVWSEINVANVARLTKAGKMQPAGFAQVEAAKVDGRWAKAYRMTNSEAPKDLLTAIEASPKARAMYATLSAQNRFSLTFRTMSLKTEEGRKKKIRAFVEMLERGETIYPNGKGKPRPTSTSRKRR